MDNEKLVDLCVSLHNIGCLKFGQFTLKSGAPSSYYLDLRLVISYPNLLNDLCTLLYDRLISEEVQFENICGVPYTALPMSTLIAVKGNKPMVMRRKEAKGYGTKQVVEGIYEKGDRCVIVEDVISTGSSIIETIADVESVGLVVKDIIAVFNREEGGIETIKNRGYNVHCLFSASSVVDILKSKNILSSEIVQQIENEKNLRKPLPNDLQLNRLKLSYENRIKHCRSTIAAKLFSIINEKKTNLCLAADVTDMKTLLKLADDVGPHICIFKVHIDIVYSYSEKQLEELKNKAICHNFLIMEDRKLADIGNTVRMQFNKISKWANLVTAHSLPGFGVLEAIKNAETYNGDFGVFLVAELSSKQNLITPEYTKKSLVLAESYSDVVAGIVCQFSSVVKHPGFIQLTPGVHLQDTVKSDTLGQQYNTPEIVVTNRGADVAVVGRAIINASNPAKAAEEYKIQLWDAYLARLK